MKIAQMIDPRFKPTVEKLMKQPLPLKTAYKLKGSLKKMDEELAKYNDLYKELIQKYASKKEDGSLDLGEGGTVSIANELIPEVNAALVELHSIEVDIDSFEVDSLGKDLELTVEDLLVLDGFIK